MPQFWKYDAKYLGGHAAFAKDTKGKFYLYPAPNYKVVFESKKVNIEIPVGLIKDSKIVTEKEIRARRVLLTGLIGLAWKKKHKMLIIDFEDGLGGVQSPVFEVDKIEDVAGKLYNMRLEFHSKK